MKSITRLSGGGTSRLKLLIFKILCYARSLLSKYSSGSIYFGRSSHHAWSHWCRCRFNNAEFDGTLPEEGSSYTDKEGIFNLK